MLTSHFAVLQDIPNPWSMPTQRRSSSCPTTILCVHRCEAFFDASFVASQPVRNTYWTRFATLPVVETPNVSANVMDARALHSLKALAGCEPQKSNRFTRISGRVGLAF
jgi:hypothetical protein